MSLDAAIAARDRGESVLPRLLPCWRASPGVDLGALLRILSEQVTQARGPLRGRNRSSRVQEIRSVAARSDAADTQRLYEALLTVDRVRAEGLLEELDDRLPNPVAADVLARGLARRPAGFRGARAAGFWSDVLRRIEQSGDLATLPLLDAATTPWRATDTPSELRRVLLRAIPDAQAVIRSRHQNPPHDDPRIRSWLQAVRVGSADPALMDAVYADPTDLDARDVLADALQQAGDPLGGFIALQRVQNPNRRQRSEMRRLLRRYARDWLGPLAPLVQQTGLRFSNGFPSAAVLASDARASRWAGCREWRTFEVLDVIRWEPVDALLESEEWPLLHTLVGAPLGVLQNPGLSAVETVIEGRRSSPVHADLKRARCHPLRHLQLTGNSHSSPSAIDWSVPVLQELETLTIVGDRSAWMPHVWDIPGGFTLTVRSDRHHPWTLRFQPDRTVVDARYGWSNEASGWRRSAAVLAKTLSPRARSVRVLLREPEAVSEDEMADFMARLGSLEVELVGSPA